ITFRKNAPLVRIDALGQPLAGLIAPVITTTAPETTVAVTLIDRAGAIVRKQLTASGEPLVFDPLPGVGQAHLSIVSPADASAENAEFYFSTVIPYDSVPVGIKLVNYPSREEATLEMN